MKSKKTDARYSGYDNFKYVVEFNSYREVDAFMKVRKWCWETFGASCEMQFYQKASDKNLYWCWDSGQDKWKLKIYLATEKQYQWFILKWN